MKPLNFSISFHAASVSMLDGTWIFMVSIKTCFFASPRNPMPSTFLMLKTCSSYASSTVLKHKSASYRIRVHDCEYCLGCSHTMSVRRVVRSIWRSDTCDGMLTNTLEIPNGDWCVSWRWISERYVRCDERRHRATDEQFPEMYGLNAIAGITVPVQS